MLKNSIAPSLLSTKVSTKKKSDVSRNVRRMRSERVNLFFVSLFAWLRTFWRVPLRKFSRFRPLKISRERYQPIIMTGKSLPDVLSTALRPVEYAAATYLLHNVPKQQKIVCFILIHPASSWFTPIHPDPSRFILSSHVSKICLPKWAQIILIDTECNTAAVVAFKSTVASLSVIC